MTENLVILRYAFNECWPQVVDLGEIGPEELQRRGITIDAEKGVYNFRGEDRLIGEGLSGRKESYGIIGVYDRTDTDHLSRMAHDAVNATGERAKSLI